VNIETEFIGAETLKKEFAAFGHFYNLKINNKIFKCRSVLNIVSINISDYSQIVPNAIVVMMNPGSSRPLDSLYSPAEYTTNEILSGKWVKVFVSTRPDNAQYQIMRVMRIRNWKYVRVLNLSDLRNGNSGMFSLEFKNASNIDSSNPHCITHPNRINELTDATQTKMNVPIIAAWGNTGVLLDSAKSFLDIHKSVIGIRSDELSTAFRYASPYLKEKKLQWLSGILSQLTHHL
jgi:hypothetical protein